VNVMRGRLIKTPLKNDGLDLAAMAAAITPRTKIIFVCNPNNPTGTIVTSAEVEQLMAVVPDHVLVVMDEAYYEFVDSDVVTNAEYRTRCATCGRPEERAGAAHLFQDLWYGGSAAGYGVACPEVMACLAQVRESFPVNRLAQAAAWPRWRIKNSCGERWR